MTGWCVRFKPGVAYIWKRKFFLGMIAIPWMFHGGTRTIFTGDSATYDFALEYILSRDADATVTLYLS